jgi:CheY-like chemotaxis protein
MPTRLDADRWGDLEILDVARLALSREAASTRASWWCGRCGDEHPLAAGWVVQLRSHLGVNEQIACASCANVARRRASGNRPARVLIVDDDPDYRDVLRRVLERHATAEVVGYVSDGREALVELARLRPDVVILDLSMPRIDGTDLLAQLRDDVKVIVVSGVPRMRERCQQLRPGVNVLAKDHASLERLLEILEQEP